MRKKLCGLLASVLVVSMLATGCGGGKEKANVSQSGADNLEVMTENTMPITEEDVTIQIWTSNRSQGYVKSFNEFQAFKEIAKITGVNVDFFHPTGNAAEQLNIMLSSGDFPDVIYHYWETNQGKKLVADGVALDLAPYMEKITPNFNALLDSNPVYREGLAAKSDSVYAFPMVYSNAKFLAYNSYFIRKDWLDKLGLSVPTNIAEWEQVLTAFRDNDMNGNGDTSDEVPFATIKSGNMYREAFASGFGLPLFGYHYSPENGKVTHSLLRPEFKEYITTMNRWYNEGLLYNNCISATGDEIDALYLNDNLGAFYIDNNNSLPKYLLAREDIELVAAPIPMDKNGKQYYPNNRMKSLIAPYGSVVTTNCAHPIEAIRYFDFLYSKQASDLMYWGIEGESYTVQPDGSYQFTDYILNNPDGKVPYEAVCKYMTNVGFTGLHQYEAMVGLEHNLSAEFKEIKDQSVEYTMTSDMDLLMPAVPTTLEEDKEIAKYSDLSDHLNAMFDKLYIGVEPLDRLDEIVEECKSLGLEKIIEIKQKAADRISVK